jgi:hypothetical protein
MAYSAPTVEFRAATSPYGTIATLNYAQSNIGTDFLPVLQGENSTPVIFRIYNNFALSSGIATAFNVQLTVWDGVGVGSHTANSAPAQQSWIRVYESGFGESKGSPAVYTMWLGSDTAIGGTNIYFPEVGSDGFLSNQIRAGSDHAGSGFIEITSYAQLPTTVTAANWTFAVSVSYEWVD